MSSANQSLSFHQPADMPDSSGFRIGIVTATWNTEITGKLYEGAYAFLAASGVKPANIQSIQVPGSFELTAGAAMLLKSGSFDAVICLGCVIQGETRHFDFICSAVAHGLTTLTAQYTVPVIFGVLTTNNLAQAQARAGGEHGNKGEEAAATAVIMASLANSLQK